LDPNARHPDRIDFREARPRRSLFLKYFFTLFIAVVVPLILGGVSEAWFGYRAQRLLLNELLQGKALSAADRIETFITGISDQIGWVLQFQWNEGEDNRHKIDAERLLQQVPAIVSITLVDQTGTERAFVSRMGLNRIGRGANMAEGPAVLGARTSKIWYGPVLYRQDSEPYMVIAVAGNRAADGIAIADINLKLIRDVIAAIKIGDTGCAFVIDDSGRLIAHPDISLVLRGDAGSTVFSRLKSVIAASNGSAVVTTGDEGKTVVAASVRAANVGWTVIAQQAVSEAFVSIRSTLWRALALILVGAVLAAALAYWLAQRMSRPIRLLEDGVQRIGAGYFDHRIMISSGDELEQLANRFNEMAGELTISKEKSERIDRLKRFLAPQVAEIVEQSDELMLKGQRREVVTIFGDLRKFTAFSARAAPDTLMGVLSEYYEALGAVITRHEATLTGFSGDGVMLLVNAPIAQADPPLRAVRLAIDMQAAVQSLVVGWHAKGHEIGFGVGVAMGPAIVGTVGYEGRIDYTAIGNAVNLASRLCGSAKDGQILVDAIVAEKVKDSVAIEPLGMRFIKGYDDPLPVFVVAIYASRIPNGKNPGDLSLQPPKYEPVIKT
jgi:class 3 adenylate cyclase